MLLGDTYIVKPFGITLFKTAQSRPGRHGSSDSNDLFILFGKINQGRTENLGPGFSTGANGFSALGFKGADTMEKR
jgi:hypothetical protein